MRLENEVAIITGGNAGIGQATAVRFAKEGAKVVVAARDVERGRATVQRIHRSGGTAIFLPLDVRHADQC